MEQHPLVVWFAAMIILLAAFIVCKRRDKNAIEEVEFRRSNILNYGSEAPRD